MVLPPFVSSCLVSDGPISSDPGPSDLVSPCLLWSCLVLSPLVFLLCSSPILSCPVASCLLFSCLLLPCPVIIPLSCFLLPRLLLSCRILFSTRSQVVFKVSLNADQFETKLVHLWSQIGPNVVPNCPKFAQVGLRWLKCSPSWLRLGQLGPKLFRCRSHVEPKLAEVAPSGTQAGPKLAQVGPKWAKVAKKHRFGRGFRKSAS